MPSKFTSVGLVGFLATVAVAQTYCAVECFQDVVTEHPPLDCTEANMYLCFCKMPSLQSYFIDCIYEDCPSEEATQEAINFGTGLCSELGFPITVPPRHTTTSTPPDTSTPDPEPTTTHGENTTTAPEPEPTETSASESETTVATFSDATDCTRACVPSSTLSTASATDASSTGTPTPTGPVVVDIAHSNVVAGGVVAGVAFLAAVELF